MKITYIECDHCKKTVSPPNHFRVHVDGESDSKDLCIKCWAIFTRTMDWLGIPYTRSASAIASIHEITIDRSYLDTGCNKGET